MLVADDTKTGAQTRLLGRRDVTGLALAIVLSTFAAALTLRVWQWHPGTPIDLSGDAPGLVAEVRAVIDDGWYWFNPHIGAPFGQVGSYFPETSVLHLAIIKVLSVGSSNAFTVTAVYFFLGFPLAGATMYLLARAERLRVAPAVVVATLFAVAPGHQLMFPHLWLASYWTIPVSLWLVLGASRGRLPRRGDPRGLLLVVAGCVVVGTSGIYYVAFTLVLLAAVIVVRRFATGDRLALLQGVVVSAVVGLLALVPLIAALLGLAGGLVTGARPATRAFSESERYAGKLMDLVLPWQGHRFQPFAFLTWAYGLSDRPTLEHPTLGAVALLGCAALLGLSLAAQLQPARPVPPRLATWSGLALVSFLFYTVGGLGSLVALFLTPQIRTWSRWWVVLFSIGLLAAGYALSRLLDRSRTVGLALCVLVLALGYLDQTNPALAPAYGANSVRLASLRTYTGAIAAATRPDCAVFQLPVVRYPEGDPPGHMQAYDQLLPYLASKDLRFSFGSISGTREDDWKLALDPGNHAAFAEDLKAAGFCALEVDRDGYPRAAPDLTDTLGAPVARSSDGRLTAWSLGGVTVPDSARRRQQVLDPVILQLTAYAVEVTGGTPSQLVGPSGRLYVANLGTRSRPITVRMRLSGVDAQRRVLTVRNATGAVVASTVIRGVTIQELSFGVESAPGTQAYVLTVSGSAVVDPEKPDIAASCRVSALTGSGPEGVRVVSQQQAEVVLGSIP